MSASYEIIFRLIETAKGRILDTSDPYLSGSVKPLRILVAFVPVIVYLALGKKSGHTREEDFYINAIFFNAFSMMAGLGSKYLARVGIYTGAMLITGYGFLFQTIEDKRIQRAIVFILLGMYFFYWVYSLQRGSLIPFRWFFDHV